MAPAAFVYEEGRPDATAASWTDEGREEGMRECGNAGMRECESAG